MKTQRFFGTHCREILPGKSRYQTILIFLLIFIFQLSIPDGFAQSLSFSMKDATLESVLDKIEKETEYSFLVLDDAIDLDQSVSIDVRSENTRKILDRLFARHNIGYRIINRQIILTVAQDPPAETAQQGRQISGTVTFDTGEPVVGATVREKGTARGTITGSKGDFLLTVSDHATLEISYLGYATRQIEVGTQTSLRVVLQEDLQMLDEVVAVGYGTQRKATLTGSVSSVGNKEIISTRNENVVNMLAGKLPGVRITQRSAQPGLYDTSIDIRGMGTPLVVIDGIPRSMGDFSRMNSEEIESISVLKDASAAIYGVRSANGVILVTTKTGKDQGGKVDISYSANMAFQQFISVPQTVGALDYMTLKNEQQWVDFNTNYFVKQDPYWSEEAMQAYRDGKTEYDWMDKLFRTTVPQHEHNLSVTGGNDKINYYFNLGYMNQEGSLRSGSINYDRWNFRSNITAQINKRLKATVQLGGYLDERNQPSTSVYNAYKFAWIMRPTVAFYANDNPEYLNNDPLMPETINILAATDPEYSGYANYKGRAFQGTLSLTYDIPGVEGLSAKASYNYDTHISDNTLFSKEYSIYTYDANTNSYDGKVMNAPSQITREYGSSWSTLMQLSLNYNRTFGRHHNVTGAMIYEESYLFYEGFGASRPVTVNSEYLSSGEEEDQKGYSTGLYDRATKSVIGRFTYDFKGKYLAEFAFRNDGSSRFPANNRWGFFPSYFLGWRASEEPFLKDNIDFLTNLKFRASYGVMGDDASAGNYPPTITGYTLNNGVGWFFDEKLVTGVTPTSIPNPNLTWYTSKMVNAGVDFDLWKGKLSGSFEVFRRDRSGLLEYSTNVIPGTVGATLPQENLESDRTVGWEITLGHRDTWKEIDYFVSAQLSATQNRWIDRVDTPASNSYDQWLNHTSGRNKNIWWGYEAAGQYQNFEQIWNSSTPVTSTTLPGDWYYVDWNEDGQIDDNDIHPISRTGMPVLNYGFSLGASYRNWDLTMHFQGAAGVYVEYSEVFTTPLAFDGGALTQFLDRWHPVDPYADYFSPQTEWVSGYYPITGHSTGVGTAAIQDASYLRLKTLEIGYSVPERFLSRVGIKGLRVYFSGYNLLTFTGLKYTDPERPSNELGTAYPIDYYNYPNNKTYNFGVNIKF